MPHKNIYCCFLGYHCDFMVYWSDSVWNVSGHLEDHTGNLWTSFPIELSEIKGLRGIFLFKIIPSIHNGEC
jgi:hypothetical protein